ncbi:MAG: AMP-binding protein [Chloroflexi bacterium]|nr:AMP-binding protein [Chloroflexota bacterium]
MPQETILAALYHHVQMRPNAPAILAPERLPISYQQLYDHINATIDTLNSFGIGRQDRVAIVLPNGPDMATAFLSIAAGAASAPLNPGYRAPEYDCYLSDLNAKAVVVMDGMDSPVVEVAQEKNIPVIRLIPQERAGLFLLKSETHLTGNDATNPGPAHADDIALVLHTSGTTSRPKIVPLAQKNLTASARNIRTTLQLIPSDRCLNVMPLFHIHGLMAAVMGSLTSGASLVCTPGFYAPNFFDWLDEFAPSWYTAVPTMHQAILTRASANQPILERANLRFVRSSSASLPPVVLAQLEETFNAPVIEAYGMTEASHQMACNPLPPLPHKPGTVGPAAGPDVSIMDADGNLLAVGQVGEIVIRGENVTAGYENNSEANKTAFTNGWLRTGDQGAMDADGYVTITGRLKEIINRGGEKISPREVDEVLLDHPDVAQSLAFAMPHPLLGEEIAAAVVLTTDAEATTLDLRLFAAKHLADYKVPRQIVVLDEIPKGPTGKLQRIGLAEKLGVQADVPNLDGVQDWTPAKTETQEFLIDMWASVLGLEPVNGRPAVGIHAHFLDLGGDSVLATQFASRLYNSLGIDLSLIELFERATVAAQAEFIEAQLLSDI